METWIEEVTKKHDEKVREELWDCVRDFLQLPATERAKKYGTASRSKFIENGPGAALESYNRNIEDNELRRGVEILNPTATERVVILLVDGEEVLGIMQDGSFALFKKKVVKSRWTLTGRSFRQIDDLLVEMNK